MQRGVAHLLIVLAIFAVLVITAVGVLVWRNNLPLPISGGQKACTQEAKICPDGRSVGRTGPDCEFATCPSIAPTVRPVPTASSSADTTNWKTYTAPDKSFIIAFPPNWIVTYLGSAQGELFDRWQVKNGNQEVVTMERRYYADKGSVESDWKAEQCKGANAPYDCGANLETSIKQINGYQVYFSKDWSNQMHAFIPNQTTNKTIEIDSAGLTTQDLFNQIIAAFKFN